MDDMTVTRTITSSEAKASLGEVLASLPLQGPVEITRNGRLVAILSAPNQDNYAHKQTLSALASPYSSGVITWGKIREETNASFGDLLLELAKQNLPLPKSSPKNRPEQVAMFEAAFRIADQK